MTAAALQCNQRYTAAACRDDDLATTVDHDFLCKEYIIVDSGGIIISCKMKAKRKCTDDFLITFHSFPLLTLFAWVRVHERIFLDLLTMTMNHDHDDAACITMQNISTGARV